MLIYAAKNARFTDAKKTIVAIDVEGWLGVPHDAMPPDDAPKSFRYEIAVTDQTAEAVAYMARIKAQHFGPIDFPKGK
jgi:hypothetical protein